MKADTAHYNVGRISMNCIAHELLNLRRYEDARIITENNAAVFLDKDLVIFTTGNIYLALNRKEDAIRFYKKRCSYTSVIRKQKIS